MPPVPVAGPMYTFAGWTKREETVLYHDTLPVETHLDLYADWKTNVSVENLEGVGLKEADVEIAPATMIMDLDGNPISQEDKNILAKAASTVEFSSSTANEQQMLREAVE